MSAERGPVEGSHIREAGISSPFPPSPVEFARRNGHGEGGQITPTELPGTSLEAHLGHVGLINRWLHDTLPPSQIEAFILGEASAIPSHIHEHILLLKLTRDQFVQQVNSPEAQLKHLEIGRLLQGADSTLQETNEARAAARIARFDGIHIASDLDGTITDNSHQDKISGIDPLLPGSAVVDPLIAKHGRNAVFTEVFATTFHPAIQNYPGAFENGGNLVPLRAGAKEFFMSLNGTRVTIVSANFEPFVQSALKRFPGSEQFGVWCVKHDSTISSTDKDSIIRHLALEDPTKAIIVIGDGGSDVPTIDAADIVACYFALEGSSFARELERRNVLHFTFKDFNDIRSKLQEITRLAQKASKEQTFRGIADELEEQGFNIVEQNLEKPWGGYLTIADEQTPEFVQNFFPGLDSSIAKDHRTTPKILVVYPGEALSWQFHERRTEFHRILRGSAGIFLSETDTKPQEPVIYEAGEVIHIPNGMRHGTIGNGQIAIIAEIWEHTNPTNPSNEEDIHRISDRYGRAG